MGINDKVIFDDRFKNSTQIISERMSVGLLMALLVIGVVSGSKGAHECWNNVNMQSREMIHAEVNSTRKLEFTFHPSGGTIMEVQPQQNTPLYLGDFSTIRLYTHNKISVFEGTELQVRTPALHKLSNITSMSLEVQILHQLYYGSSQYEFLGMSHIFTVDQSMHGKQSNAWERLASMRKGQQFQIWDMVPSTPSDVFVYKLQDCPSKILWLISPSTIPLSYEEMQHLHHQFPPKVQNFVQDSTPSIYTARVREQ